LGRLKEAAESRQGDEPGLLNRSSPKNTLTQ
jgi:hypothetical protein